ncbi:MAG: hypothetical protein ACI4IQ_00615 [Eubacterium sp.]
MKKFLSVLTALCVVIASALCAFGTFAQDSVEVSFAMIYAGEYAIEPSTVSVSADLSDTYESAVGYNDSLEEPTVLDALIAAHIDLWGDISGLSCSGAGWLTTVFGKSDPVGYYLNDSAAGSLNDSVKDGDYLAFAFYQDTYGYSDAYASFNVRAAQTEVDGSVNLTAQCSGYDSSWNIITLPCAEVEIFSNGTSVGKTDADGKITLNFDEKGTYNITTAGYMGATPLFPAFCAVTVTEKASVPSGEGESEASSTTKPSTSESTQEPATDKTQTAPSTTVKADENSEVEIPSLSAVKAQMLGAADYLSRDAQGYDISSAIDYLTLVKSGKDMSAYNDGFLKSVKDNLDKNNGRLMLDGKENIALYGAVIQILDELGFDPYDFEGYDLISAFTSMDISHPAENPYFYRPAIGAAALYELDDFGLELCKSYIDNYYTMGSGMNYYGYSCDNTADFITALSPYCYDYENEIDDALTVLESYRVDGGYCYNPQYGTEPNCDSTASALKAYASIGDIDKATQIYNDLCAFESNSTGVFTYGGEENALATKDALLALEYYADIIPDDESSASSALPLNEEANEKDSTATENASEKSTAEKAENINKSEKSPATGADTASAVFISLAAAGVITLAVKKKRG